MCEIISSLITRRVLTPHASEAKSQSQFIQGARVHFPQQFLPFAATASLPTFWLAWRFDPGFFYGHFFQVWLGSIHPTATRSQLDLARDATTLPSRNRK